MSEMWTLSTLVFECSSYDPPAAAQASYLEDLSLGSCEMLSDWIG